MVPPKISFLYEQPSTIKFLADVVGPEILTMTIIANICCIMARETDFNSLSYWQM